MATTAIRLGTPWDSWWDGPVDPRTGCAENAAMPMRLLSCLAPVIASLHDRIRRWTRPSTRPVLGYLLDRFRSPEELARENTLLRKQLEVACRQSARPRFTRADRGMLVLLARLCPTWQSATLLV